MIFIREVGLNCGKLKESHGDWERRTRRSRFFNARARGLASHRRSMRGCFTLFHLRDSARQRDRFTLNRFMYTRDTRPTRKHSLLPRAPPKNNPTGPPPPPDARPKIAGQQPNSVAVTLLCFARNVPPRQADNGGAHKSAGWKQRARARA